MTFVKCNPSQKLRYSQIFLDNSLKEDEETHKIGQVTNAAAETHPGKSLSVRERAHSHDNRLRVTSTLRWQKYARAMLTEDPPQTARNPIQSTKLH